MCPAEDQTHDPLFAKQTLYLVTIKVGFHHKAVEVYYILKRLHDISLTQHLAKKHVQMWHFAEKISLKNDRYIFFSLVLLSENT